MNFFLDKSNPAPYYLQIVQQVRARIAKGQLRPGDELPTIRGLATQLNINPNTVVRAYQILQQDGLIVMRRPTGTFVSESAGASLGTSTKEQIMTEKVDALLKQARELGVDVAEVIYMLMRRDQQTKQDNAGGNSQP